MYICSVTCKNTKMKRIERHNYLQKLIAFKDKKLIKVITGIRRCGKSTIMEIYRDWLIAHGVTQEQIIYLNFEDYDYFELRDPRKLYSYVKPLIQQDKMTYIFFDYRNSAFLMVRRKIQWQEEKTSGKIQQNVVS